MKYVLITSARNEQAFIAKTLDSVAAQTQLPERWLIIDDGSTDRTAEIAESYAKRFPWIILVRNPKREGRNFAAKAGAVNAALAQMKNLEFDVLGNLDADVSFAPGYMEFLMRKFATDPQLGVAGTPFTQPGGYDSMKDSFEGENFVAGPIQLFRRDCFRQIGGYVASPAGGVDWIAVMTARMKGWTTRSFAEKRFHHHRSMGTAEKGELAALFSYGEKDYYLGGSPVWQLFRVTYRLAKKPFLTGGLALLFGYSWAAMRQAKRPVSDELMRFHRREQMKKLKAILRSLFSLKKVDNFRVPLHGRNRADATDEKQPLQADKVSEVLKNFVRWLENYGEVSWDHQSFFAGPVGSRAKALYYKNKLLGTAAVAPMIFCEAFFPAARRLFHHPIRLPIADAHYAMGFAFLHETGKNPAQLEKAVHFLYELEKSRCPDFKEYCWGYPFDWVTRNGVIKAGTPLITTTPYAFEAFLQINELQPRDEWEKILESITRHACDGHQGFQIFRNGQHVFLHAL